MPCGEEHPIVNVELGRTMQAVVSRLVLFIGCCDVHLGSFVNIFEPSGEPGHTFYKYPVSIGNEMNWVHWVIPIHQVKRGVAG